MKRLPLIFMLTAAGLLAGCASMSGSSGSPAPLATAQPHSLPTAGKLASSGNRIVVHDQAGSAVVQKVEFRVGVSSTTVEHLARRFGCAGSPGAGLVTSQGPVEVYRMQCDNGTTFLAECEMRQCRPLR